MPDNLPKIKTTKVVYPQIYSYTLPEHKANEGSQKIGYTERKDVDARINEQTHTAAIKLKPQKLWSAPSFFADNKNDFNDKTFHKFLVKNGVENRLDLGKEWFYFDGTPEKSKELFDAFREQGFAALQNVDKKIPYSLRTEQQAAVTMAKNYFTKHSGGEVLWNAKPRFGKTLATYDLAKQMQARKVLIVTNRPAIANSWLDDFEQFVEGYMFISETSSLSNRTALTREQFVSTSVELPQITFLSLQDMKGSRYFGGDYEKLEWVADLEWDMLVIDEAHEGIDTERTDAAFDIVKRKYTLHLSGTPFKALANNKFPKEAIFNWTYLDEQKIKQAELEENDTGDHTELPNLKLYTYRISEMVADEVNEGIEIDNETRDFAFDLNEFFATKDQKFVHEEDVREFLKNLTSNTKYPFSTPDLREELRHTFWYVGNRVDSVKALEQLLKQDDILKDYKIVVAAGDGKSFEEEENDFYGNEKSFDKVKKAIAENPRTITLSCGQLTAGVTIKEWSAVLMLTDIKTPAQYMQAAFRAQNPHRFYEDGQLKAKESAYLFDFAPTRVLEIYDQFANGLNGKAANGEITESERKENIKELLNFFPVISEDIDGKMVELDAEKVLTFPNALAAAEIVKARFMTNLLFNDNVKGVFSFPKEVEDILDKMPIEKNKRAEVAKSVLDLDDARKFEQSREAKINENSGVILGEKIFRSNIERVVDNALNAETTEEIIETLPDKITELAEPLIAKYKEVYKATNAEVEEMKKETDEKVRLVVAEYESSEIKDTAKLKENLANVIENDLVIDRVEQKETEVVEKVQKTKEEEVRDRLRSFTRTIPMFIMANSTKETINIDNFDDHIDDNDFEDLTNITKDEFYKLRDGFDYDENGERKTFGGVFDRYKFNASIAEFVAEKQKRADYFNTHEDIFELIPNQKNNQIFTPRKVVQIMINSLEKESPELFERTDSTFIDLYMKSGMYITEIVKKLFTHTRKHYNSDTECLKHILENQVYGLAPTKVLYDITQSYIFGFDQNNKVSNHNFVEHDLLPEAKDDTAAKKLAQLFGNGGSMMKFDAVVGNPPYQENSGTSARDDAIYNYFYDTAVQIADKYCLISPARFLFNAGSTPRQWNKKMLNDTHLKIISYAHDSSAVFPNVGIAGGVVIIFRDATQEYGAIGTFTSFDELNSIASKVNTARQEALTNIISGRGIYRLTPQLHEEHPEVKNMQSAGHKDDVGTGAFDKFIGIIFFKSKPNDGKHYTRVYGRLANERTDMWIRSDYINKPYANDKYRVIIPKAYGTGITGVGVTASLIGKPFVIKPNEAFTEMYISIGDFESEQSALNALKYVKSKFARVMLAVLKVTQDNTKEKWSKVPLQDFTSNSDIDWSKSIPEIDQQLYAKYKLSKDEIEFIESHVKPMV